jgi:acetyl esterase/lipase
MNRPFLRCAIAGVVLVSVTTVHVWAQDAKQPKKSPAANADVPAPTMADVRYGEHERNVLDFWKADSKDPTPLVFVIHGGGWVSGDKDRVARFADVKALLAEGISVVAINYRLISRTEESDITPPVKAPLEDAARALQFVRSKAVEWNIDEARIGAAGGSAGACSSLWLAFHNDLADPNSEDPIARQSTRLWCAAVIGAQTTLDPAQMKEWTPNSKYGGHAFGFKDFTEFFGQRETITAWISEYSPYALVSTDDPPVYLIYSAKPAIGKAQKDPTHTSNFGVKLQEHCVATGVECQLVYPGAENVNHKTPTDYLITTLKSKAR